MTPPPPSHVLKRVATLGRDRTPVALQNENGPCPLLACANALLLKGEIELGGGAEVSQERLIQLVAGALLDRNDDARLASRGLDAGARANAAANVGAAVAALPKLATGVDVNVRFSGPADFEFTDEVAIFDLLGLPLVHGWVCGADDAAAGVVGGATYNEAVELAIQDDAGEEEGPTTAGGGAASPPVAAAPPASPPPATVRPGLDSLSPSDMASAVEKGLKIEEESDDGPAVVRALVASIVGRVSAASAAPAPTPPPSSRAALARSFLQRTAGQLTPAGLVALHEALAPGAIAVLFRNNHFSTVVRPPPSSPAGGLFALVTDVGYARVGDVVYERLDSVDGDTALVGGDFLSPPARRVADADSDAAAAAAAAAAAEAGTEAVVDADHALAVRLQEEEDARARAARADAAARRAAAEGGGGGANPPPPRAPGQGVRPVAGRAGGSGDGEGRAQRRPRTPLRAETEKCCVM